MNTENKDNKQILERLDALIRIQIEKNKNADKPFTDKEAAKILNSVGLTPTEIAKIMGKTSRTAISSYIYSKDVNKNTKSKRR